MRKRSLSSFGPGPLLLILLKVLAVSADTLVALELVRYDNQLGTKFDGTCCDATGPNCAVDPCDYQFSICLDSSSGNVCTTPKLSFQPSTSITTDSFAFPAKLIGSFAPNPFTFQPLVGQWTGSVPIKVIVEDRDGATILEPVDTLRGIYSQMEATSSRDLALAMSTTTIVHGVRSSNPTSITLKVSVFCESNYYGPSCNTYCKIEDSCEGHYTCNPDTGFKNCTEGWMGMDCTQRAPTNEGTCQMNVSPPLPTNICERVDVVFVIDVSGSTVVPPNVQSWQVSIDFVINVVSQMNIGSNYAQVGVVLMGTPARLQIPLNQYTTKWDLLYAIGKIAFLNEIISIQDALQVVRSQALLVVNGDRLDAPDVVIVVTDGAKQSGVVVPDSELTALKDSGAEVFVVMHDIFANQADKYARAEWLKAVTVPTNEHLYVFGATFTEQMTYQLAQNVLTVMRATCGQQGIGAGVLASTDVVSAAGLWTGTFTCQGQTYDHNVDMAVNPHDPRFLIGEYTFTSPSSQKFREKVSVVLNTNNAQTTMYLTATMWMEKPAGSTFNIVSLSGNYAAPDRFEGNVISSSCSNGDTFVLTRYVPSNGVCENGATCIRYGLVDNQFYCCCPPGFTGQYCLEVIKPCEPHPCGHGECVADVETYTCNCPIGYHGSQCEHIGAPITCADNPCENKATCVNATALGYSCECPEGFTGDTCQIPITPCSEFFFGDDCSIFCMPHDDCQGHYTCSSTGIKSCLAGWTGPTCTSSLTTRTDCPNNQPCMNGGTCFQGACCCVAGYTGGACQLEVNECASQPCQNNGVCLQPRINMYECNCTVGFYGVNCQSVQTLCEIGHCKNGGTCRENENGSLSCICHTGFSGPDCSIGSSTVPPTTTTEGFLELLVKFLTDFQNMDTATIKQIIESIMPILTSRGFIKSGTAVGTMAGDDPVVGVLASQANSEIMEMTMTVGDITITFFFNLARSQLAYGPSGQEYTQIPFTYEAFDAAGNPVPLAPAVIDSIVNVIIDPVNPQSPVQFETGSRPFNKHLELVLKGEHLDRGLFGMYEALLRPVFLAANPEFGNLNGFRVDVIRADEAISKMADGSLFGSLSVIYYWLVYTDGVTDVEIDPTTIVIPTDVEIMAAMARVDIMVEIYTGDVLSLVNSFGLFVTTPVFKEDNTQWTNLLMRGWRNDPVYAGVNIIVGHSEMYYTNYGEVTRLFYFVFRPDGTLLKPNTYGVTAPTESSLQNLIQFNAADGSTVQLFIAAATDMQLDHTSISSPQLMRKKEACEIYAESAFSPANYVAIEAVLKVHFESVFPGLTLKVVGSENTFSATYSGVFGVLRFFIQNNNGMMVDARRFLSSLPSLQSSADALVAIERPNGARYTFITNRDLIAGIVVRRSEAFYQIIEGTLPLANQNDFLTTIMSILAPSAINIEIRILANEEYIDTNGLSNSVLFLGMMEMRDGLFELKSIITSSQLNVNATIVEANLPGPRSDGTSFVLRDTTDLASMKPAMELIDFFCATRMLERDEHAMTVALVAMFGTVYTDSVQVNIVQQEEMKDSAGISIWRLRISLTVGSVSVVVTNVPSMSSLLAAFVPPTSALGHRYELIADVTYTASLVRVASMFTVMITSPLASTSVPGLSLMFVEKFAEVLQLNPGEILVDVRASDEYMTISGTSTYRVLITVRRSTGVLLPRRITSGLSYSVFSTIMGSIPDGRGHFYRLTLSPAPIPRRSTLHIALNRHLLIGDVTAVEAAIANYIVAQAGLGVSLSQLTVKVVRETEGVVIATESPAVMLEIALFLDGSVFSPNLVRAINLQELVNHFPSVNLGRQYGVLDIALNDLFDLHNSFKIVMLERIEAADMSTFILAITTVLREANPLLPNHAHIQIIDIEEAWDKASMRSVYIVHFAVSINGHWLDGSVERTVSLPRLQAEITRLSLSGPRGLYRIVTEPITAIPESSLFYLHIREKVIHADRPLIEVTLSALIKYTVKIISVEFYVDSDGAMISTLVYTVHDADGLLIPRDSIPVYPLVSIQAALDAASMFAPRYSLMTSTTLYEIHSLLRIPLRRPVLIGDHSRLEVELGRVVGSVSGYSSCNNVEAKFLKQAEGYIASQRVYVAMVLLLCDGHPIEYDLTAEVALNRLAMISITLTGELTTYGSLVLMEDVNAAVFEFDTILITIDTIIKHEQLAAVEAMVKVAFGDFSQMYNDYTATIVSMDTYYTTSGHEQYVLVLVVRDGAGHLACRVDLPPLDPSRLEYLLEQLGITGPRDQRRISVLNLDMMATVPGQCTVGGVVLSDRISSSDVVSVQNALALMIRGFIKQTLGHTEDKDTRVAIVQQKELAWKLNVMANAFELVLEVHYNGHRLCSNMMPQLPSNEIRTALDRVNRIGSDMTYADIMLEPVRSELAPYTMLFRIIVQRVVERVDFGILQNILSHQLRIQYDLGVDVNAVIWKEEFIEDAGLIVLPESETHVVVSFGLVHATRGLLDSRLFLPIDIAAVRSVVATSALAGRVVVISGTSDSDRFDHSQKVCFFNEISEDDYAQLSAALTAAYTQMDRVYSAIELNFLMVDLHSSAQSRHWCVYYLAMINNQVLHQAVDVNILIRVFQERAQPSAIGQEFLVALETVDNLFEFDSYAFAVCLDQFIFQQDIEAVMSALKQEWIRTRPDLTGIYLTFLRQTEVYTMDSQMVACSIYRVNTAYFTLNSMIETDLTSGAIASTLSSVHITGSGIESYGAHVYSGAWEELVARRDLCTVVLNQKVAASMYSTFQQVLEQTWRGMRDVDSANVQLVTELEVAIGHQYTGFALLYKVTDNDNKLRHCQNFQLDFYEELRRRLDGVVSTAGEQFTLVPIDRAISFAEKQKAYSVFVTRALKVVDQTALVNSLAQTWREQQNEPVQVVLSIQEEHVSLAGKTLWNVRYYVTTAGGTVQDRRIHRGPTIAALAVALGRVAITGDDNDVSYDQFLYTGRTEELLPYSTRFSITLRQDVRVVDLNSFQGPIMAAWNSEKPGIDTSRLHIHVLQTEEVLYAHTIYYQVVYFVVSAGELVDSRCEVAISSSTYSSFVTAASLRSPLGHPYEVAVETDPAKTWRVANSLRLLLDNSAVAQGDIDQLQLAIRSVWGQTAADVTVTLATTELYVYEGRLVTACIYFLNIGGHTAIPSTLLMPGVDAFRAMLTLTSPQGDRYEVVDNGHDALPYRHRLSIYLDIGVKISDLQTIENNLYNQWTSQMPDLPGLEIVAGLQEEMCTPEGSYWQLVYFLRVDGFLLSGLLTPPLSSSRLQTAMRIPISTMPNQLYSNHLVTDSTDDMMRLDDLFVVYVTHKVAVTSYMRVEEALEATWRQLGQVYVFADVEIIKQERFVTDRGHLVWGVHYSLSTHDVLQRSGEHPSVPVPLLQAALAPIYSPRGQAYMVYSGTDTLLRYSAAFATLLKKPVQIIDQRAVLRALTDVWTAMLADHDDVYLIFAAQEEHLDVDGSSVYKFAYFVYGDSGLLNAVLHEGLDSVREGVAFDVTISGTTQLYKDQRFYGIPSSLVPFHQLIAVPMMQMVAERDFAAIRNIIRNAWTSTSSAYRSIEIEVRAQEEYLLPNSEHFYYVLLYSARLDSEILSIEDLPELDMNLLDAIETLPSPTGIPYSLADVPTGALRRVKQAMHIFLDRWVARSDLSRLLDVLSALHQYNWGNDGVHVEFGAMEWYAMQDDDDDTIVVRLTYFAIGAAPGSVLDAMLEKVLNDDDVQNQLSVEELSHYDVLSIGAELDGTVNLRHSLILKIKGMVAKDDLPNLEGGLEMLWNSNNPQLQVDIVLEREFVGSKGETLTGLVYVLRGPSGLINPMTVLWPSKPQFATRINVISYHGQAYEIYTDEAIAYDHLYAVEADGTMDQDEANTLINRLHQVWNQQIRSVDQIALSVRLDLVKMERAFGDMGSDVTRVLYAITVNDMPTFPQHDPENEAALQVALSGAALYDGQTAAVRLDHHLALLIRGPPLTKAAVHVELALALKAAYEYLDIGSDLRFYVGGMDLHARIDSEDVLMMVYYTVRYHGSLKLPADLPPPSADVLASQVSARIQDTNLESPLLATLSRVRHVIITKPLSSDRQDVLETDLALVWQQQQHYTTTVQARYLRQRLYATPDWMYVFNVLYAVFLNGSDPDTLHALQPSVQQIAQQTDNICGNGCDASRVYQLYLSGSNVAGQLASVREAVLQAWSSYNPEVPQLVVEMNMPLQQRLKRQLALVNNVWYEDDDKNAVSAFDYTVSLNDKDVNPLFVAPPSDEMLDQYLLDTGTHACGCNPLMCTSIHVMGVVEEDDVYTILEAIRDAYMMANTDLESTDIEIHPGIVTNDLINQDGEPLSKVEFCVKRLDGGHVHDLIGANRDQLDGSLGTHGWQLAPHDTYLQDPGQEAPTFWIYVIIGVCGFVAIVLMILAVGLVIQRRRQSAARQDKPRSAFRAVAYNDEEDFAGHGLYGGTAMYSGGASSMMYANGSLRDPNGSIGSKVALYDTSKMYT